MRLISLLRLKCFSWKRAGALELRLLQWQHRTPLNYFLNQGTKWDCTAFISQWQQVAPSVCLRQQASFTHSFPETQPETIPCGTQTAHFNIFSVFLQLNLCLKNSLFFPPINFPTFPVTDWCDFYVNALSFIFPPSVSHYIFLICPISPCFLYVY